MIQWKLETRKLSSLKDNPKNPRILSKHDADQLTQSLERFGLADKPICNTDGTIIGGHQRKKILKRLGYKEVEVWVPDRQLSNDECDELCIRLNRNHGDFDDDILANEWDLDKLVEYGFTHQDLSLPEINDIPEEEDEEEPEKCKMCPSCGYEL